MAYQPKPDSLAAHVCAFFAANPDDELSAADVVLKFDVHRENLGKKLLPAVEHGWLVILKKPNSTVPVYAAGPNLGHVDLQPLTDRPAPSAPAWPLAPRDPLPDPDELVIEHGVVIPAPVRLNAGKYHALFARMADGDSFVCTPKQAKLICNNGQKWGKDNGGITFMQRRQADGTARVWRVGKKASAS